MDGMYAGKMQRRSKKKKQMLSFRRRSLKSRGKRLKGRRKTEETEYQRNLVLLSALARWNLGTHLSRATSH